MTPSTNLGCDGFSRRGLGGVGTSLYKGRLLSGMSLDLLEILAHSSGSELQ
jgi:hypothetical protein